MTGTARFIPAPAPRARRSRLITHTCLVIVVALATAASSKARADQASTARGTSIRRFLAPDGSVDLQALRARGRDGTLDLSGFEVGLAPGTGRLVAAPEGANDALAEDEWADGFYQNGVASGTVYALAIFRGDLIAAGDFIGAGTAFSASRIARWDGTAWNALGGGIADGSVNALTVWNDALIAGGSFTHVGVVSIGHVASWNGAAWTGVGTGLPATVNALTVYPPGPGGELIAGGAFNTSMGAPGEYIARWNGSTWRALGPGANGVVNALAVYPSVGQGAQLIAGGNFTLPAGGIARWDGTSWQKLGAASVNTTGFFNALATFTENNVEKLAAGGLFQYTGGPTVSYVARWDGAAWSEMGLSLNGTVQTLAVYGGQLHAGGYFTSFSGPGNYIARWDGTAWGPLDEGTDGPVFAMTVFERPLQTSALFVGGSFTRAGGQGAKCIARWDGTTWSALDGLGMSYIVHAMAEYGGAVIVGGEFTAAGPVPASYIARFASGSWSTLAGGLDGTVRALTIYQGDLIASGDFSEAFNVADTVQVELIARWNGTTWRALDYSPGLAGSPSPLGALGEVSGPRALAVYGGRLIVGGDYLGYLRPSYIAAWDDTSWSSLGGGDLDGGVNALALYGGSLIVGGDFTNISGQKFSLNHIAAWSNDTWAPLAGGMDASVEALVVQGDSLFAGGDFTNAGCPTCPASRIARWHGGAWTPLGAGLDGSVRSLGVYNNALIAGGAFTHAGGPLFPASRIARWNGSSWGALGSGVNDQALVLKASGGSLYVGGTFLQAGNKASAYIARRTDPPPPASVPRTRPSASGLTLERASPNPFARESRLAFVLPRAGPVQLSVHDVGGRLVRTLLHGFSEAGRHTLAWDGADDRGRAAPGGLYFVRLEAGSEARARKLLRLE